MARSAFRVAFSRRCAVTQPALSAQVRQVEDLLGVRVFERSRRRVLLTPFHNMALMCPDTTQADVDAHTMAFAEAADAMVC